MWNTRTVAEMEAQLVALEADVAEARTRQLVLVNELDKAQAPQTDGSRSMIDWVQSHMDIKRDTATDLVFAARRFARHRGLHSVMLNGDATFDRTVAAVKLADTGVAAGVVDDSYDRDLPGVWRLISRNRRSRPRGDRQVFTDRFFTIQPNLDGSSYRIYGQAPGLMGRTIDKAITDRADELRRIADDLPSTRGQRQLDAMAAMAQDSLDRSDNDDGDASAGGSSNSTDRVTVFVDTRTETPGVVSAGSPGADPGGIVAEIEYGPRVGPDVLEEILCSGRVQIVGLKDGYPVVTSPATRTIPPAIRHFVANRDGGCVIDGCRSQYRLEPHHITHYRNGGSHHPNNLASICWYHHHVAIHGDGYRIDPESPPLRRRLHRGDRKPRSGSDPP